MQTLREQPTTWVKKSVIAELLKINWQSVRHYYQYWEPGLHFSKPSKKTIRFNYELINHWLKTRGQPHLHEEMKDFYRGSLSVGLPKRGRKSA